MGCHELIIEAIDLLLSPTASLTPLTDSSHGHAYTHCVQEHIEGGGTCSLDIIVGPRILGKTSSKVWNFTQRIVCV